MLNVVENGKYVVGKISRGYILINTTLSYEHHAHFKALGGVYTALRFIQRKTKPTNDYFITSLKRVLSEEEFNALKLVKKKPHYININKGVRR